MTVDAVSTFLAVGSLLLLACVVAVWVLRLVAVASGRALRVWDSLLASMSGQGARLALLMATVAMLGSLYFSEIAGFIPCEYCWYQRIAMYPLVVILTVGLIGKDQRVHRYVYPLASIGALIAAYHYSIQRFPDLASGACSTLVPCTTAYVWKFDLVSIPFMAFVSFAVIITVLLLDRGETAPPPEPEEDPAP